MLQQASGYNARINPRADNADTDKLTMKGQLTARRVE
jgi:hypothetical protein